MQSDKSAFLLFEALIAVVVMSIFVLGATALLQNSFLLKHSKPQTLESSTIVYGNFYTKNYD